MEYVTRIIKSLNGREVYYYLNNFDENEANKQELKLIRYGIKKEVIRRYTVD